MFEKEKLRLASPGPGDGVWALARLTRFCGPEADRRDRAQRLGLLVVHSAAHAPPNVLSEGWASAAGSQGCSALRAVLVPLALTLLTSTEPNHGIPFNLPLALADTLTDPAAYARAGVAAEEGWRGMMASLLARASLARRAAAALASASASAHTQAAASRIVGRALDVGGLPEVASLLCRVPGLAAALDPASPAVAALAQRLASLELWAQMAPTMLAEGGLHLRAEYASGDRPAVAAGNTTELFLRTPDDKAVLPMVKVLQGLIGALSADTLSLVMESPEVAVEQSFHEDEDDDGGDDHSAASGPGALVVRGKDKDPSPAHINNANNRPLSAATTAALRKLYSPLFAKRAFSVLFSLDTAADLRSQRTLCLFYSNLVHQSTAGSREVLATVAFFPRFLSVCWSSLLPPADLAAVPAALSALGSQMHHPQHQQQLLMLGQGLPASVAETLSILSLFCRCYGHILLTVVDAEFLRSAAPFSLGELPGLVAALRPVAVSLALANLSARLGNHPRDRALVSQTRKAVCRMLVKLRDFYTRNAGDQALAAHPAPAWLDPGLPRIEEIERSVLSADMRDGGSDHGGHDPTAAAAAAASGATSDRKDRWQVLLAELPFVLPFLDRVRLFLARARVVAGAPDHPHLGFGSEYRLTVNRARVYEDSYNAVRAIARGGGLRRRWRVNFTHGEGLEEAGIDGGGLFKEWLTLFCKTAFADYGLFSSTEDNLLYPNPASDIAIPEHLTHFEAVGAVVGKAMVEGVLVDVPFAGFFLSKLLGHHSYLNDLRSLDPVLSSSLISLKGMGAADVEDLGLTFTIVDNMMGEVREVALKPNGSSLPVTAANRLEYIALVANYRLNVSIRAQCEAFKRGLYGVIDAELFQMFDTPELATLIAGTREAFQVADLKRWAKYGTGYSAASPQIVWLWEVVEAMTAEEKALFLRFVTSHERAPLLGFEFLSPPFCVGMGSPENDRLPSAATCLNMLKLPPYDSKATLHKKLLTAITAGAGFELS
jgi:hypothetical protein